MYNVNFARTVLIILVVIFHSCLFWAGDWIFDDIVIHSPMLGIMANWIGTYHTQALTAVSGFTYEYITEKRGGYFWSELLNKKIRRLLIPFIVVSLLWILPLTSFFIEIDSEYIVNKFVQGKSPAQLWFLLMLFDVFMLFFPLRKLLDKSRTFYIVFPLLYIAAEYFGNASNNYFQFFTALKYLSFFALGHLVYRCRDFLFTNGKCKFNQPQVLWLLAIIHVIAYIVYLQDIPRTKTLLMLYLNFGGCFTAMAILLYLGEKVNPKNKLLAILNKNSFALYLFHQQIIYYTLFYLNGQIYPVLHAFINFVVSFVLSLAISIAIRKNRFVRVYLLGEKK